MKWIALIVSLLVLGSCGATAPSVVVVREQDAGRAIVLQRDDQLRVWLKGNPSTGYQWLRVDSDTTVLTAIGEPVFHPDSRLIGAPGTVELIFKAAAPGEVILQLHYRRSFEPQAPPAQTFELTVRVEEAGGGQP